MILKDMGIYEEVKRSFVNFALGGCIYEINSIRDPDLREEAIKLFLTDHIYRFDIADKPKSYFFLKYRYLEFMEMKKRVDYI